MASKIALPTVVTSGLLTLAGCRGPQPTSTLDFGPPPQESTSQIVPDVENTMRELAQRVRSGEIDASDGISRDEAQRMMCAYLLRRSELSDASLKRSLASDDPEYTVLRDAQRIGQLGALLRELNPTNRASPRVDTEALPLDRSDDMHLVGRIIEGIYLARADRSLLDAMTHSRTERNFHQEIATWLEGLLQSDLRLTETPGSLSQEEVRARLFVDEMIVSWFSITAASRFVESYPEIMPDALNQLSPHGASILRGDPEAAGGDPAVGLATFSTWWSERLDPARREMWERGTPEQRRTVWVLFRSIPVTAYTGYESVTPVSPTAEEQRATGEIFGPNRLPREAPPLSGERPREISWSDPRGTDALAVEPALSTVARLPDLNSWMLT